MKTYERITHEVQRSDFQIGANPESIGKLNECLLWRPWRTVSELKSDEPQLAKESAVRLYKWEAQRRIQDGDATSKPMARFRVVRVVATVSPLFEVNENTQFLPLAKLLSQE
jgi:hypothetical protein